MSSLPDQHQELIGRSIPRVEDPGFLTGRTRYTDDYDEPGTVYLALARSQRAHATITKISTEAAARTPGVREVFTADDIHATASLGEIPVPTALYTPSGTEAPTPIVRDLPEFQQPFLATGKTRYVGEPVAAVVAADRYAAHTAANQIGVEYERLPAVTDSVAALEPDAPVIHDERPNNVAFEWKLGNTPAAESAFDQAEHTVTVDIDRQRVISNPMEPRGCLAEYDPDTQTLTIRMATQGPHSLRDHLAEALGLSPDRIDLRPPAVGGSFGTKSRPHPGELLTAWAATEVGRPIKWQATRAESHLASAHGRGHAASADLALDANGRIRGLRVRSVADVGAYVFGSAPLIHTKSLASALSGQYRIPAITCHVTGAFTNTTPITAFRGTSRPMAILLIERAIETAANTLGQDPVAIRRRNLIPPSAFPYQTPLGFTYDTGDYEKTLDRALELLAYDEWRARQRSGNPDRRLGIGLSCSVDQISSPADAARIRVDPSGMITTYCGTYDTGQGHFTTFAQLVADELEVPLADVNIVEGDTDTLDTGGGTGGSRSVITASATIAEAAAQVREEARRIAGHVLEAAPGDLEYRDGGVAVKGAPDRAVSLAELATAARDTTEAENAPGSGIEGTATVTAPETYSFATHAAVVEIDSDTGTPVLHEYVAVEDCGPLLNPQVVHGQIHGAIAQGLGQSFLEEVRYDETGTLQTASFQDYAIPKAFHLPDFTVDTTTTPAAETQRGVKGIGESGANATPAAITNAIYDALDHPTGSPISPPFTPEKLWRYLERNQGDDTGPR